MPCDRSSISVTRSAIVGVVKLGHPLPDSNLVSDENSSAPHPPHRYVPSSWQSTYFPVNARSVPPPRSTAYCSGVSVARHSSSVLSISGLIPQIVGSPAMDRYQVEACNTATASANKIHDDTVAKGLGFRGGLVPGVDVFAYLTHAPAARWGRAWLETGWIDARFASPVYDGDTVTVESDDDDNANLRLRLVDSSGNECATGTAGLGVRTELTPIPERPEPQPPLPPASPEAFAAFPDGILGSLSYGFHADKAGEYLADVRETLPLYTDEGIAHPGWLLRMANWALSFNVQLGPWIHVGSEVQFHRAVEDGARISVRSRVDDVTERKGHRLVGLDVAYVVDDTVVASVHHTSIYEPRALR